MYHSKFLPIFLNDEEQTKPQTATLGQEMKNQRAELQEHRVNPVEGNSRTVDPNQKGRQNEKSHLHSRL